MAAQSSDTSPPPEGSGSEKTVYKSLGLSGGIFGACPCAVDVKDGKVIRIRPNAIPMANSPLPVSNAIPVVILRV